MIFWKHIRMAPAAVPGAPAPDMPAQGLGFFFYHLFSFPLQVGNTMLVEACTREHWLLYGILPPTTLMSPVLPDCIGFRV